MEMSEIFWTFLVTSVIGLFIAIARMAYKSKCKEVDFCCIKIIRDTEVEEKEFEFRALHNINQSTEDFNITKPPTPINRVQL